MTDVESIRRSWSSRLSRVRRRLRWHQAAEGAATLAAWTVGIVLILAVIDWRFELSAPTRSAIIVFGGIILVYQAIKRLLVPLLRRIDLLDVAALVDRSGTAAGLSGPAPADPLPRRSAGYVTAATASILEPNTEDPLRRRAVEHHAKRLEAVPVERATNSRHLLRNAAVLLTAITVPLALAAAIPWAADIWAQRWIAVRDVAWPRDTSIEVLGLKDGVLQVPRGESASLAVRVRDKAEPTSVVWLRVQPKESDSLTATLDRYGETASEGGVSTGDFRGELPPLATDTSARVWGGDARSGEFLIRPVDRPQIVGLDLAARHPAESQDQTFDLTSGSDVRLLRDSVARLTVTSSVPVAELAVDGSGLGGGQNENGGPVIEQISPTEFAVTWTQDATAAMRLSLRSDETGLESFPRSISVGLLPDRPPSVTLRHTGVRLRVTPVAEIPLSLTAHDDFGINRLLLRGESVRMQTVEAVSEISADADAPELAEDDPADDQATSEDEPSEGDAQSDEPTDDRSAANARERSQSNTDEPTTSEQNAGPKSPGTVTLYTHESGDLPKRLDREHRLLLEPLALKPGDVVTLTGEAVDAAYSGEQTRQSRSVVFRVVKSEDLFREVLLRLQQLRSRLRKAADDAEVLSTDLKTAELPREASMLSRRFQVTRREVAAVTEQIDQTIQEMSLNKLGGQETTEIIARTVVEPLKRLQSGAMDRQRRTLADLASQPDGRQEAVERQDEIVETLREALKNMAQWDSFVDVVNQLNAVINLEKMVKERTDALRGREPAEPEQPAKKDDAAADIFD